jgi:hypothetical protein
LIWAIDAFGWCCLNALSSGNNSWLTADWLRRHGNTREVVLM